MAVKYARAGGGNWTTDATWSTTSGGAADTTKPTAADDAVLDAASGNVTIDASTAVCRSLDCNGYTGTLTHTAAMNLTIGDGTAGAGNRAIRFSAGMTYTLGSNTTSTITFVSTSSTVQTVTTAGKTAGNWTFNGTGGSWQFADAFTYTSSSTLIFTAGTLDFNNQTVSGAVFQSSNSNARTLTLGSSAITLNQAGTPLNIGTPTNLTMTANTAIMTLTGASPTINVGGKDMNGMSIVINGGSTSGSIAGGGVWNNFTITGTAAKTNAYTWSGGHTITGTLTLTGNSAINRVLHQSTTVGTARTITAAAISLSNVDFQDITGAGLAGNAAWTGTSMGDALGNSNITFDTPATQTHTASAGGNWSDVTKWTSRVPLPQDNVVVDVNTTGTLTEDMPRFGKDITFTGFAGTLNNSTFNMALFGSLALASGMTVNTTTQPFIFSGRGTHTLTSAGKTFPNAVTFQGPGGTYTLQDALIASGAVTVNDGTFTTNNFNVTCTIFTAQTGRTTVINPGTSTITITTTAVSTVLGMSTTGTTFNGTSATLVISTTSFNTRTIGMLQSAQQVLGTLTYTVADSSGMLAITNATGSGSSVNINTLNVSPGRSLNLQASRTLAVTNFNVNGTNNGYIYLPGVAGYYISAPDSAALSITGDITLDCKVALSDWTPATSNTLIAKEAAAGTRSYRLYVNPDGTLGFVISNDGTAFDQVASSVATGFADGTVNWVRASASLSTNTLKFYTSSDGSVWTQLGANVAITKTSIFDGTQVLEIGSVFTGTTNLATGKFYNVKLYNSYLQTSSGTPVFNADFTTKTVGANSFTESSANAATVTINGTLAQVGDGRVSLISSSAGSAATLSKASGIVWSKYMVIQDSTATGGATWYAGTQSVNVSGNSGWLFVDPIYPKRVPTNIRSVSSSRLISNRRLIGSRRTTVG